jgi:hypothetical protein
MPLAAASFIFLSSMACSSGVSSLFDGSSTILMFAPRGKVVLRGGCALSFISPDFLVDTVAS